MDERATRAVGGLRMEIDRDLCIGSGGCIPVAPQLLELDQQQVVRFRSDGEDPGREAVIEACSVCPVGALAAYDGDTAVAP